MATKMRRARVQDADDELVVMPNVPTKLLKLRSRMNARNKTCAAADQIVTKVPVVQSMNVTKVPLSCCACGACHSPTALIAFSLASVPPNIQPLKCSLQSQKFIQVKVSSNKNTTNPWLPRAAITRCRCITCNHRDAHRTLLLLETHPSSAPVSWARCLGQKRA